MDNKRQRPSMERACKTLKETVETGGFDGADPLALDPKLWRKLPTGVAYKVLSFLPADRLVDTLRVVNRIWEKLLGSPRFLKIFGHGKNLFSSYGFVTLPNHKVPRFSAFEHESMQWLEFPKKLQPEVKQSRLLSGSSDGLLLCASKKCKITNLPIYTREGYPDTDIVHYPDIGVWNPLLRSFKWLPEHPKLTTEKSWHDLCSTNYIVMVDEPSRTYKVFLDFYIKGTSRRVYSVYDRMTGSWSACKLMPKFESKGVTRRRAACGRYIFFDGHEYRGNGQHSIYEDYVCWYDAQKDAWDKVFLSKILTDLSCSPESGGKKSVRIESFAILHGLLYMVIQIYTYREGIGGTTECDIKSILASLDLSTLGCEFGAASPIVKLETVVPVTSLPSGGDCRLAFNLYTYTVQGKGYVSVRTSSSGHFLHFDVSRGDWLEHDKFPLLGSRNWSYSKDCFLFKPSLVVP